MHKPVSVIEWTIAQNDADWERRRILPLLESESAANRHRLLQRDFWRVTALLLLLVAIGDGWNTTQGRAQQDAAKVTALAHRELAALPPERNEPTSAAQLADWQAMTALQGTLAWTGQVVQHEHALEASLPTLEAGEPFDPSLSAVDVQGDQAVLRVVMLAQGGPYRQTLFYRRMDQGWRQVPPEVIFWGPERSLETPYFVYHYRQNDAAAVLAVAPRLGALYTTLHRNFGLLLTPSAEKQVIEVRVTQNPGNAIPWFSVADRWIVPSPVRYLAPVELTDVALLEQSLALPLLAAVLARASEQHAIRPA